MKILIETSARHVHLNKEALEILFGENFKLTNKKDLSQPGQFLSNEKVEVIGPRSSIKNISILGPLRKNVQVEISKTDARVLGVEAPIRESGDLINTPGCLISGPAGLLKIESGVIIAKRHAHLSPEFAEKMKIENGQLISVKVETVDRPLAFSGVVARVDKNFSPAVHIDTDEANAANVTGSIEGEIL